MRRGAACSPKPYILHAGKVADIQSTTCLMSSDEPAYEARIGISTSSSDRPATQKIIPPPTYMIQPWRDDGAPITSPKVQHDRAEAEPASVAAGRHVREDRPDVSFVRTPGEPVRHDQHVLAVPDRVGGGGRGDVDRDYACRSSVSRRTLCGGMGSYAPPSGSSKNFLKWSKVKHSSDDDDALRANNGR